MELYLLAKQILEQCQSDEDVRKVLPGINGLFAEITPKKQQIRRTEARLSHWPRAAAIAKGGDRISVAEIRQYMEDNGVGHWLPRGFETTAIERSLSKNLGRTWQKFSDGTYGLITKSQLNGR
jgi:hypothetical protein